MIRYKKTVLIAMLMVVISTAFSTNVFAGGFGRYCANANPHSKGAAEYYEEIDESKNISFSFDTKKGRLVVKKCRDKGEMRNFSSIRMPHWDSYKNQITSIEIEDGVTKIGNSAFAGCKYVTSITIPDSVKEIGNNAFQGCKSLNKVEIPASVTKIGRQAFAECIGLSSITYKGNSDLDRKDVFEDCLSLKKVNVPSNYTEDTFCGQNISKVEINSDKCDADTSKLNSK